jgi:hypothetical protein
VSPRALALVALAILFFVLPSTTTYLADWLWFGEVGYQPVFLTSLYARGLVGLLCFILSLAWLAGHLRHALVTASGAPSSFTTREGFTIVLPTRDQLRPLAMLAAAAAAVLVGLFAASEWMTVLTWWYAAPFAASDPILGRNVGFYVFTMPLLELARGLGIGLVLLAAIGSAALYVFAGELALTPFGLRMSPSVRRHGALLAAAFFLLLALGAWLDQPRQLISPSGIIQGASYTDVHARMPAALALAAAALVGSLLCLLYAFGRAPRGLIAAAGLYALVLVGGTGYASIIQRFVVAPNEQARETPYILHNIEATRQGFALDRIEERELTGDAQLTRADIDRNRQISTTSGSGITSRCSRRSARSRRFAPTTT